MPTTGSNPVIAGFHPDPSICRVGDDFYLAVSSFQWFPGVPIFTSRDLVHWRQIGNVLDRASQLPLETAPASMGIFAPTLRHHDGRFWMVTTNLWGHGNFFVTAEDPAGPWSEPVPIDIPGIDPDLAWDDAGRLIVTSSGIAQTVIDQHTGAVVEPAVPTWSGTGLSHPEAPHLYEIDGHWYLLIAEGGTERGHAVSIARGDSPNGPFEGCPHNPILSHRSLDLPIKNTGHADLVELADGSWWMVLLAVRPRGFTPHFHVLGRETFLAPVEWVDGWPLVGDVAFDVTTPLDPHPWPTEPARDDFDASTLHPRWISPRRRRAEDWSLDARAGWLRLHGNELTVDTRMPVFVGRRQQHHHCRVAARIEPAGAGRAGLSLRMDERHHASVVIEGARVAAVVRVGDVGQTLGSAEVPGGAVDLEIRTQEDPQGLGPDRITLGFVGPAGPVELASIDGRYFATEVTAGFTGRVIGVFAESGDADVDWVDYEPLAD